MLSEGDFVVITLNGVNTQALDELTAEIWDQDDDIPSHGCSAVNFGWSIR
jgi:hypothetical protein